MYKLNDLIAWVDLSTYCNAACPQCHRTNEGGLGKTDWLPLVQWSLEQFKQAFPPHLMSIYKRFELCGTWGDPIMNKDIFEIVEYILTNSNCTVQVNTNGSIRDADWWWKFGVMGGSRLQTWFDIDGIDQEMHSLYRQSTDLEKIKENVTAYCATNARACAMVIVFKHNQDYLYDIYELICSLGVTGQILFTESNRFYRDSVFKFTDESGTELVLEQSTLEGNHPLLNSRVPIRDHKWRKKLLASGEKRNDYW
jgi:MoaA/NifB/PqqE/SkfB family radical SAM enzyme